MFKNGSEFQVNVYTVSDLTAYVRALLESNENLMDIWVAGEISNLSQPKSGHMYFTLKDVNASLRCVIWREHAWRLKGALRDGMAIEAHGHISVYEQGGQYQLYVDGMRAAGEGLLYQEFLRLKAELETEGLFDPERKQPLPRLPRTIGIVTSPTGAALQDMLNTLQERCPLVQVVLAPAAVQGENAPPQIVAGIQSLNDHINPDVIIVGRGGGSLEDLWAFNDERVVRAVAESKAPIISGVGHETDFTLTDFAADFRAPTPTGAAVTVIPHKMDLEAELNGQELRLRQGMETILSQTSYGLTERIHRLDRLSPDWFVHQSMQYMDTIDRRITMLMAHYIKSQHNLLKTVDGRLINLDPNRILKRGYALIRDDKGRIIREIKQVKLGQEISVRVTNGAFTANVKNIQGGKSERKDENGQDKEKN